MTLTMAGKMALGLRAGKPAPELSSKGGHNRANKMTAEERSLSASLAAKARWSKYRAGQSASG